jgi:hypothetical protein
MSKRTLLASLTCTLVCVSACLAMIEHSNKGTWPDSWPKELERYRDQSKSLGVGHGIQEDIHEIQFLKREEFEKAWPYILTLKSPGSPLLLEQAPSTYSVSGSKAEAGVRILCSTGGILGQPKGKRLIAGPPWPDYLKSPTAELPEYVVGQEGKWTAFNGRNRNGFIFRARVDIVLICDGNIVDLNRIPLPPNTQIIDNRFEK